MTRWLGIVLLVLGPLVAIGACIVIVAQLAAFGDPSPRLLQAQLDSANAQLDIARYEVNHLRNTLPQVAATCQKRRRGAR